jgi:quinoprotein glucose dehydrogenase
MRLGWTALLVFALAAGCGGKSDPNSPDSGNAGGDRITGNERLGWNQSASSADELNRFRFVAYVDGTRVELTGVQCSEAGGTFQCASRLPPMTPGAHTIELASYTTDSGQRLEGPRSAPLRVTVTGAIAGVDPQSRPAASQQTTADGQALRLDVVAVGVEAVTAIAFSADGFMVVGERSGRIHIVESQALNRDASAPPALDPDESRTSLLDDVAMTGAATGGLLDLALDPAFVRTRFVYALYTAAAGPEALRFRIVRFREAGGRLGERAVLLDDLPASSERPAGTIAFGPDGKLYAAFDDGGDASQPARPSAYSGKVLRLNPDGTTPQDQPASSPVFASDYRSPRGLDWHPVTGALWIADAAGEVETIRVIDNGPRHPRTPARSMLPLPRGTDAAAIAFARGSQMPALQGDLFAASASGRHLLRLRLDKRDPTRIVSTERLFPDTAGAITAVVDGPDGALYLGTDRAVLRIGPR